MKYIIDIHTSVTVEAESARDALKRVAQARQYARDHETEANRTGILWQMLSKSRFNQFSVRPLFKPQ